MEARVTKVSRVSARFSKSLARRRLRPNQEKVRSTTQRRGRTTKPFVASLRLTIAIRHTQRRHLCHRGCNLPRVVAAISPDQCEPREAPAYLVEDQSGPIAAVDRGGVDHDPHRQPFAVDQGADLAALHMLAGVVTHLVVFTALNLAPPPRAGLPPHPLAQRQIQLGPDRLPDPSMLELAKDVVDRRARRKSVAGQIAPRAAGAQQIQNGVHRRPHVGLARSPARRRPGDQWLQPRPLSISPIARISDAISPIYPTVFLRPHRRRPSL